MNANCSLCKEPVIAARTAVGDVAVGLKIEPMAERRVAEGTEARVLVGGFAWRVPDVVEAIAVEARIPAYPDALLRTINELDWHLAHQCMAVPA
jgi:hypothetical protein